MTFELKPLPYAYDALEPYIDRETMQVHHDKHHQTYVDKLNAALADSPELQKKSVVELLKNLNAVPEKIRNAVKNHGGGTWNHEFFWNVMKKDTKPTGAVVKAIEERWGSLENFKKEFTTLATTLFGSGWTWLVLKNGKLELVNLPNQDCPLSDGSVPLLTIDVWEHAYYLKHKNKRADYVEAFWHVINWDKVNENYGKAKK